MPIGQPSEAPRRRRAAGAFDAQLLGQDGRKRGLKGGTPVLEAARTAYLETKFSGEADRRLPPGLIARAKV
jgi:hypothetical protein